MNLHNALPLKRSTIMLTALLLIQLISSAQTNKLFNYTPNKTATVIHVDLMRLYAKSPANVFQHLMDKFMISDDSASIEYFKNPAKTGIDFSAGMVINIHEEQMGMMDTDNGATMFLKIKDPVAFTSFMEDMHEKKHGKSREVTVEESFNYEVEKKIEEYGTDHVFLSDYGVSAAWNNEVVVFTRIPGKIAMRDVFESTTSSPVEMDIVLDTTTVTSLDTFSIERVDTMPITVDGPQIPASEQRKRIAISQQKQRQVLFELLTTDYTGKFLSDPEFRELSNQQADVRIWSTENAKKPFTHLHDSFIRLPELGNNKSTTVLNFEKGRISMFSKTFPSLYIKNLYEGFKISPQNGELLRKLPPENVIGLMSITIDQKMVDGIMNFPGFQKIMQSITEEIPFKIDPVTIASALKPNMMMALLKSETVNEDISKKMRDIEFLMAVPIADKAKFEAMRAQLKPLIDSLKKTAPEKFHDAPMVKWNDELLVLALSAKTADAFLYNPAPGESPAWIHEFSQFPVVINVDFKKLFETVFKPKTEERAKESEIVSRTFDQLFLYGGNYNNGAVEMNMDFRFGDKEKNALVQLFNLVSSLK